MGVLYGIGSSGQSVTEKIHEIPTRARAHVHTNTHTHTHTPNFVLREPEILLGKKLVFGLVEVARFQ